MDSVLGYSLSRCELLGHFGPDGSFGKTSGELFPLEEEEILSRCSGSFPRSGMMRSGVVYVHPISAINTDVSGCSLWPTPRVITGGAESATRKQELGRTVSGGGDLQDAAQNWPTPMAADDGAKVTPQSNQAGLIGAAHDWDVAARQNWPAPQANSSTTKQHGKPAPEAIATDHVARLDPATSTPGAPSSPNAPGSRRRLNPVFVCWLQGFPLFWTWLPKVAKSRTSKKRFQALMEKSKSSST